MRAGKKMRGVNSARLRRGIEDDECHAAAIHDRASRPEETSRAVALAILPVLLFLWRSGLHATTNVLNRLPFMPDSFLSTYTARLPNARAAVQPRKKSAL